MPVKNDFDDFFDPNVEINDDISDLVSSCPNGLLYDSASSICSDNSSDCSDEICMKAPPSPDKTGGGVSLYKFPPRNFCTLRKKRLGLEQCMKVIMRGEQIII